METRHGGMGFSPNYGDGWWGWQVSNVGRHTIFPGRIVIFSTNGITNVMAGMVTSDYSTTTAREIIGIARQTIAPTGTGYVAAGGYFDVFFTGVIANTTTIHLGSAAYTTRLGVVAKDGFSPGIAQQITAGPFGSNLVFAWMHDTNYSDSDTIRGVVFPWRE